MLNDSLLENRLNSFKKNKNSKISDVKESAKPTDSLMSDSNVMTQAINSATFVLQAMLHIMRSIILGFALKTVFQADWTFLGFFTIGFSINYIINTIAILLNKKI